MLGVTIYPRAWQGNCLLAFLFVCFVGFFFGDTLKLKRSSAVSLCVIIYFSKFVLKATTEQKGIKSCITHVTLSETVKEVDCPC